MKKILFFIVFLLMTFQILGQTKKEVFQDTTLRNDYKNFIGVKSLGPLFLGNIGIQYVRIFFQKGNYFINLETDFLYGYKLTRYTNNFGFGLSCNGGREFNKNHLIIGIGGRYLFSPKVNSDPSNPLYSNIGTSEARQTINVFVRFAWRLKITKHLHLRLAYDPGIAFKELWRYPQHAIRPKYEWHDSTQYLFFECSILYNF